MEATGRYHEPVGMELHDRGIFFLMIRTLLILRDLFFDGQIEFFCHLVTLLGVVNDVEAVGGQRRFVAVHGAETLQKGFEDIDLIHILPRYKVQMASGTDFRGFQRAQIVLFSDQIFATSVRFASSVTVVITEGLEEDVVLGQLFVEDQISQRDDQRCRAGICGILITL